MSKVREKDSGRFAQQASIPQHPNVDKIDLSTNPAKPIVQNFRRGNLGPDTGHARANMPQKTQGPTVEPR